MSRRSAFQLITPLVVLFIAAFAAPHSARADGIVIIDPPCLLEFPCPPPCTPERPCPPPEPRPVPLAVKYHRVNVTITNQVAVTHVDQVFRNDNGFTVEGVYIFPLPLDAAVTSFTLWVDGKPVDGEVLGKDEARQIYENIVASLRDPALLEYAGQGAVQASLFPIDPGEERRIELEYSQVLPVENGLVHYLYPLNTEKFSSQPLEQVSVSVRVQSNDPVRAIYSPSHSIAINRESDYNFTAGYEETNVTPATDFEMYYSVDTENIGLSLLTFRDPTGPDPDGFFLLLAAPAFHTDASRVLAKDVILVLDQSGSMEGEKFQQAQEALKFVLDHLNPEDRFNVIAFSTGTRQYAEELQPASRASDAMEWVDRLGAEGGTDINLALLEAMRTAAGAGRPSIVIFLTDGLPTEGETNTEAILQNVSRSAPDNARLFAFGVGDDVDTILLDTLVEQNHGASAYVRPGQRIDEEVSAFYQKVSAPVLAAPELAFGSINTFDLFPQILPDLFAGSQIVLLGRYSNPGPATLELSGLVGGGDRVTFSYPDQTFRESGGPDFLPRLWATRKIGYLLNQIRLHGAERELVDQVVALSIRYGIVTPYTSYLVTEENVLGAADQARIAEEQYKAMQSAPTEGVGGGAVDRAQDQAQLEGAEAPAPVSGEATLRIAGERAYLWQEGVWVDTAYDSATSASVRVAFASQDYFDLLASRPALAPAFALGSRVIAFAEGTFYEVVDADQPVGPIAIPPTFTPEPTPDGGTLPVPTLSPNNGPTRPSPTGVPDPTPTPRPSSGICGGAFLALGLIALPLLRKRRR